MSDFGGSMSQLQKKLLMSRLPPVAPPNLKAGPGGKKPGPGRRRDYTPVSYDSYFDKSLDVVIPGKNNTFRVYQRGNTGPVCFFLHGGGFSALTWALLSKSVTGLVACRCAAIDLRGHGSTRTADDDDLSADTLATDVIDVVQTLYGGEETPPIILVGHSMGGAIAVHVANKNLLPSIIGLVVIDVVEGTALDALTSMQGVLRGRPKTFNSLEKAIEWSVRSGTIRNIESARVSMMGQVRKIGSDEVVSTTLVKKPDPTWEEEGKTIGEEDENGTTSGHEESTKESQPTVESNKNHISPESGSKTSSESGEEYTWRIDLTKTEKYWKGWFQGLSKMFLSCNAAKLLLLAGIDRLDKDLTVGQMQGKFQMQVLPQCGHAVHEDVPDRVAEVLATFMIRNKFAEAIGEFKPTFPAC